MVARSSADAEYRGIVNAITEIMWVQFSLNELGISLSSVPVVWCDNMSVVVLTANLVQHSRMKHIALNLCFPTEKVQSCRLLINYVLASDQVADILKKNLTEKTFAPFRKTLCVASTDELQCSKKNSTSSIQGTLGHPSPNTFHLQNSYTCVVSNTFHPLQIDDSACVNTITNYTSHLSLPTPQVLVQT